MPKFHISKAGGASKCNAKVKACPLGESPHGEFESQVEANQWAESKLAEEYGGSFSVPTAEDTDHAIALAEWEEENQGFFVSGTILDNDFRKWDVDYLKSTLPFAEDSAAARETISYFEEKVEYGYEEVDSPEAAAVREELRSLLAEYNSTPSRKAAITANRDAQARAAEQYRLQQEAADQKEASRREALGPAGRWEEDYSDQLGGPDGVYLHSGVPEALDAAIQVADESPAARKFIDLAREAVEFHEYDEPDYEHPLAATVKASLARYDATPRRQAVIQAAAAREQAYQASVSNLSSSEPALVRDGFNKLASQSSLTYTQVASVVQNPAAPPEVVRAATGHLRHDEDFIQAYDHPSQPFADSAVSEVSRNAGFQRYDFYAKKIDKDRFGRADLERLREETSEYGSAEKPVTAVLRKSLLSRLRARLSRAS